ncbi:MerR family transcriptional regulator [Companilactobacillus metriopterae]|uniref:MerR family transcriptional regulator n=1 Tax=Companilactobacillus metriopterae TaxID=1909267 RepID=UPI00100A5521|nr:MerR family transcriptional regulator [Companilactobacillus metriopterae]
MDAIDEQKNLKIGELADIVGVSSYTIRFYEKEELVKAHRTSSGIRYYTLSDVNWLKFILYLKKTGMTISELKTYVKLRSQGDSTISARLDLLHSVQLRSEKEIQALLKSKEILDDKVQWYEDIMENGTDKDFEEFLVDKGHSYD